MEITVLFLSLYTVILARSNHIHTRICFTHQFHAIFLSIH